MSRTLTSAYTTALASGRIFYVVLVEMFFDSGTSRYAIAPYNVTFGGYTYLGVARIAGIEPIRETADIEATGFSCSILANAAYISLALNENIQGRKCVMRLALLDENHQLLADPLVCFQGRLDQMNISLGKVGQIKVTAESRFAAWDTARVRRFNSPDQKSVHPADTFFDFVPQMVSKELQWGVPSPSVPAAAVAATSADAVVVDGSHFGEGD